MNNQITFGQVVEALEKNDQPFAVLPLQNKAQLVVSQRGGRILGPFLSAQGQSLFWLNKAFTRPDSFSAFLYSGDWNLGGERIWIAPEIQYLVKDRADFWGSIRVPAQMDPGQYTLDSTQPGQIRLRQTVTLAAFNLASGQKELTIEKVIRPVEDPLRHLRSYATLAGGLLFAGYEQTVSLAESRSDEIMSEVWNLVQLNPGGQLLIPAASHIEYNDYFEPVDSAHQTIYPHYVCLNITGQRRYKVGYKAAQVFGRLAYLNHLADGRACLIVRNFFNNPSAPYAEEPAALPGQCGHSIHVYNDDGALGGFGELECNGQTIGGATGKSATTDQFVLWLYVGNSQKIKQLIPHLLGIEL